MPKQPGHKTAHKPVAALIATNGREKLLLDGALPSVLRQNRHPEILIIVDDSAGLRDVTQQVLQDSAKSNGITLYILRNQRHSGVAGAWNTGLAYLCTIGHKGFVAILDDDDTWDEEHIEANLNSSADANIVVSGLRLQKEGKIIPRPLIEHLDDCIFLTGNPGWQGSNTFVSLKLLHAIGGFREGLISLNDRDLAIRLLRHPQAVWSLTNRWTATWNLDTPNNLSSPRSPAKREGLRSFWRLYGEEMTLTERSNFFERAKNLFDISAEEILSKGHETIPKPGLWKL